MLRPACVGRRQYRIGGVHGTKGHNSRAILIYSWLQFWAGAAIRPKTREWFVADGHVTQALGLMFQIGAAWIRSLHLGLQLCWYV